MVIPAWVAAMICAQSPSVSLAIASRSPASTALNGSWSLPLRVLGRKRRHPVEREHDLRVERMRDPERAVLVEGRDAVLGRHEVGAALGGHRIDELDDRLLGRPVVPGRQRVVRLRGGRDRPSIRARGDQSGGGSPSRRSCSHSGRAPPTPRSVARDVRCELVHDLVDAEGRGLLARRELLEALAASSPRTPAPAPARTGARCARCRSRCPPRRRARTGRRAG